MQFQRISPTQVLVLAPVEEVREAAWHVLASERIANPVIDVEKNLVSGSQGDGVLTVARVVTTRFEAKPEGTLVSFDSRPVLGGRDMGARGREKKLASALERVLVADDLAAPDGERTALASAPAPIADPSGAGQGREVSMGQPLYGAVLAPRRGITLLCYGLFSLICCPLLAPLTLIYGLGALRDYKRRGDPGDKALLVAAVALAAIDLVAMGVLLVLNLFFA